MYKITKVLKAKNKDVEVFENMEDLKNKMQEMFGDFEIEKPYIYSHLIINQNKTKGYFVIKETYKNFPVSPSEDLYKYLIFKK